MTPGEPIVLPNVREGILTLSAIRKDSDITLKFITARSHYTIATVCDNLNLKRRMSAQAFFEIADALNCDVALIPRVHRPER